MKFLALGLIVLLVFSAVTPYAFAETKLWDLQIQINVENTVIFPGDQPIISGRVTDQASHPVSGVQVRILVGAESKYATTDEGGYFKVVLTEFNGLPGTHVVNVMATAEDGRMGIQSINFQVRGELTQSSVTERRLSTDEAVKYLNSTRDDYTNNSIGLRLYDYYQNLYQKLLEEKQYEAQLNSYDVAMQQKRDTVADTLQAAIALKDPGPGAIKGYQFKEMTAKISEDNRDIIAKQLNYTAFNFLEARLIRDQILANGGSQEEARKAYLEKLTTPRDMMEQMTTVQIPIIENVTSTNSTEVIIETNSTETSTPQVNYFNINGTNVNLGIDGTTIVLDIGGKLLRFIINGTQLIPVTNSTE